MFSIFKKKPKTLAPLPFKTDIHCHIVPGVDDGSPDVTTSVELVERMRSWGIERIFASPHVTESTFENTPEVLDKALESLNAALAERENPFKVSRHAEYRLDDFSMSQINGGIATTMPGGFILIENSFMQEPFSLEQRAFDMKLKGMAPILAHPERYSYYSRHNRQRYQELHDSGLLFQINLLSLANYYGDEERDIAEWLIEKGLVDYVGTDMHHHRHADAIEAYLTTRRAEKHYKALCDRIYNDTI